MIVSVLRVMRRRLDLRSERGSVSLFTIGIVVAALLLTALIVDGGRVRLHRRLAGDIAQQAARAGAQELDEGSRLSGGLVLDGDDANAAAYAVVAASGADGSVAIGARTVTVDVTIPVEMIFLDVLGTRTVTASRSADATEDF